MAEARSHSTSRSPSVPLRGRLTCLLVTLPLVAGLLTASDAHRQAARRARTMNPRAPEPGGALPGPLPLFPADNWWNLDISAAPIDPGSDTYIARINQGGAVGMHPDFGGDDGSVNIYGFPYVIVDGAQAKRAVEFVYADESDGVDHDTNQSFPFYPIPDEAITQAHWIEGGEPGNSEGASGDRHLLLVDRDNRYLYELYHVSWNGSQWTAGSGAFFDLNRNDRRPEGWTSADAAGLAILPGLIRYDEVFGSDEIRHAFRVTVQRTCEYVYPASHSAGTTSGALPMGARLRLKASVDISGFRPEVQKIFRAMKRYGLIVADNGANMYVSGTYDTRWDNDILNPAFAAITAADFEVVQLGFRGSPAPGGHVLTIARAGTGAGSVQSSGGEISCGSRCSATFYNNAVATLTATPLPGSAFAGWTGDADCADGAVTMTTDHVCTANFVTRLGRRVTRGSLDLNLDGGGDLFRYNPVTGDWSMDFSDRAGKFGSSTGTWSPDWQVYPADFNGDDLTDFLLYNASTGTAYQLDNTGAAFNYSRADWSRGWNITVLDFDGDGRSDLFLYNPATGIWFRALNTGLGIDKYVYATGGAWSPGFTVSKGDFNGDGRDDLFLYHDGAGTWWEVLTTPGIDFTYAGGVMSEGWTVTVGDYNGDGKSDVLLYRPTDGIWFEAISKAMPGDWRQLGWASADRFDWSRQGRWDAGFSVASGDFNGDRRADLFLYHPTVGTWWQALTGPGGTLTTWNGAYMSEGWQVSVTDLDGDGRDDVLLYRPADGVWFTALSTGSGTFKWTSGNWGAGWTIIASR